MHAIVGDGADAGNSCIDGVVVAHRGVLDEGAQFEGARLRLYRERL